MAARIYMFLLFFTGVFSNDRRVTGHRIVTVANYNIWNVMFQWETRKQYIAEMVIRIKLSIKFFVDMNNLEFLLFLHVLLSYLFYTFFRFQTPICHKFLFKGHLIQVPFGNRFAGKIIVNFTKDLRPTAREF